MAENTPQPAGSPDEPGQFSFPELPQFLSEDPSHVKAFRDAMVPLWNESGRNGTPDFAGLSGAFAGLTPEQLREINTPTPEALPNVSLGEIAAAHELQEEPGPHHEEVPDKFPEDPSEERGGWWARTRSARWMGGLAAASLALMAVHLWSTDFRPDADTRRAIAGYAPNLEKLQICERDMLMQLYADQDGTRLDRRQIAVDRTAIETARKAQIPCTAKPKDQAIVARYVEDGSENDADLVRKQVTYRGDFTEYVFANWPQQRRELQKDYIAAGDDGDAKDIRRKLRAGNLAYAAIKNGLTPTS